MRARNAQIIRDTTRHEGPSGTGSEEPGTGASAAIYIP